MFRPSFFRILAGFAPAVAALISVAAHAADCVTKVPADALLEPGKVLVSINPVSPPMQYVDSDGTLKGMRVDLGDAIIKRLCLASEHIRVDDFGTMIPGLQAGRWDIINTGVFFTEARAKVIYMVRYEYEAISIVTRPGEADKIKSIDDLSGKTVGVDIGGYEENKLKEHDAALKAKGLPGINIQIFNDTNITYQALRASQVDAVFTIDAVSKEYADRGIAAVAVHGLDPSPVAICFRNKALAQAFADVLTQMRADGSYQALFDKYGKKQWTDPFDVKGPDM
jgi:polar amino acid transport system substrate-binding protein